MHDINVDKLKKILIANLSGYIDINQGNIMLSDFKKAVAGLNTKEYTLIINPENVSAGLFVIPTLQSFIKLITELKFKRIYLVNSDKFAALIKNQLANSEIAASLRFAPDVKEALKSF